MCGVDMADMVVVVVVVGGLITVKTEKLLHHGSKSPLRLMMTQSPTDCRDRMKADQTGLAHFF